MPKDVLLASLIENTSNDVPLICEVAKLRNNDEMKMENLTPSALAEQYKLELMQYLESFENQTDSIYSGKQSFFSIPADSTKIINEMNRQIFAEHSYCKNRY